MSANGQLKTGSTGAPEGSGGSLTLETYAGTAQLFDQAATIPTRGKLFLDGTIDALGMSGGGTLTLQQVAFQIGGNPATMPSYATYFDPTAWGNLGFGSFVLNSVMSSTVPADTTVTLHHANLLPDFTTIGTAPTGSNPAAYSTVGFLTGTLRSPTNLSVTSALENAENQLPITSGDDSLEIGAGAQILGDPGATISLSSSYETIVLGTISAPGGTISLTESAGPKVAGPLYLGPDSVLDVSGTAVINPRAAPVFTQNGLVTPYTGEILPGGTINLTDNPTLILVAPGAELNVSGASGAFDVVGLAPGGLLGNDQVVLTRQAQWSNAGQVNITSQIGMLFEGTLIGNGGAPQAAGGTLSVNADIPSGSPNPVSLILVQDTAQAVKDAGLTFSLSTAPAAVFGDHGIGLPISDNVVLFGADSLNGSGFDNLVLKSDGGFAYTGQVSLHLGNSVTINASGITAANQGNYSADLTLPGGSTKGPNGLPASLTVTAPYIALNGLSALTWLNSLYKLSSS